jgi:hypothetical protein
MPAEDGIAADHQPDDKGAKYESQWKYDGG